MDSLDDVRCPQFCDFGESFDKENDDSYFGTPEESFAGSESTRKRRSSSLGRSYNLRATPSRKARLSHLINTDPDAFNRSYLSAALPQKMTPSRLSGSKSLRKRSIHSKSFRNSGKGASPNILQSCENVLSSPFLADRSMQTESASPRLLPHGLIKQSKQRVRFDVRCELKFCSPTGGIQRTLTPKVKFSDQICLESPAMVVKNNSARKLVRAKRLQYASPQEEEQNVSSKNECMEDTEVNAEAISQDESVYLVNYAGKGKKRLSDSHDSKVVKKQLTGKPVGTGSTKATVAKPFNFQTDKRIKSKPSLQQKKVDFVQALRKNTPKDSTKVLRSTKPKPFQFSVAEKPNFAFSNGKEKTFAEKVQSYWKKTPQRFRTKAANEEFKPTKVSIPKLVRPQSPNLQTVKRKRRVQVMSHAQHEELEVEKMKEYKFHAQPFNKRLLNSPHLEKPQVKPPTVPMDIHLETEKRTFVRHKDVPEEKPYVFHAQDVPKSILKGPVGIKEKPPVHVTEPQSPCFALKKRVEQRGSTLSLNSEKEQKDVFHFKAGSVPSFQKPFTVKHEKRFITADPFSFEQFDKERMLMKEKKIQEEIENDRKKAEFHARPLPASILTPRHDVMSNITRKPPTKPEPFNLLLDKLAEKKSKDPEPPKPDVVKFKARSASVIKKQPFIPRVEHKCTTVVSNPCLSTEKRAAQRMKMKELQQQEEAEREALLAQQMREKEEKEKEEIKRLRQAIVHKANPVRNYQPVTIKQSSKPLTRPRTPKFATDLRLGNRTTLE